jgi:hypothetical protein
MLVAVLGPPLAITRVKVTVDPTSGVVSEICLSNEMSMSVTSKLSLAVFPVPLFVEVTLPLVLLYVPAVGAVTSTVTVQDPLAAIVPPLKDIDPTPALAVTVPPQLVDVFGVGATTIDPGEVGKVSLKATPVIEVAEFGLVIVKVKVLTPSTEIGSGEKFFEILGGDAPK